MKRLFSFLYQKKVQWSSVSLMQVDQWYPKVMTYTMLEITHWCLLKSSLEVNMVFSSVK